MIIQRVKFKSSLSREEVLEVARKREAEYRSQPGLIQKFYVAYTEEGVYGGTMIWDSAASLAAFRETKLAQSVPEVFGVIGEPEVEIGEVVVQLHEAVLTAAA